jgi:hypothetical protein
MTLWLLYGSGRLGVGAGFLHLRVKVGEKRPEISGIGFAPKGKISLQCIEVQADFYTQE